MSGRHSSPRDPEDAPAERAPSGHASSEHASSVAWATARAGEHAIAHAPRPSAEPTSARLAAGVRHPITRKRRRRRIQMLAVLTVLVVGGSAGYLSLPGRDAPNRAGGATSPDAGFQLSTQEAALFQVRGPAGDAVASALVAHDDAKGHAAVVMVPNRVAVGELTAGGTLFGQTLRGEDGPARSRRALSDLIGVRLDDSWVLDQPAFARLVGRLGGITADVDADIVSAQGGAKAVAVPKGKARQLDGTRALAVLNYRPPGKDELASLPRVQEVLQAVLAKLPPSGPAVADLAAELGDGSQLSDILRVPKIAAGVRVQQDAGRVIFATVPVLAVAAGGELTYRVEPVATTRLVSQVLAGSARIGRAEQGYRVLAIDGVGRPRFGGTIRDRVVPAGFTLVDARKEKPAGRTQTVIVIFDTTSQSTIRASQLASALGLPDAAVRVSVRTQNIADLIVHVGSDFTP